MMAKKMTKKEIEGVITLIIIGIPVYLVITAGESIGWISFALITLFISILYFWYSNKKKKERLLYLQNKYNDNTIVQNIISKTIWIGQTEEQVIDSLGKPQDIDQKVLKTKKKEIWKYGHQGANRYKLRITLDNDEVVGWDHK